MQESTADIPKESLKHGMQQDWTRRRAGRRNEMLAGEPEKEIPRVARAKWQAAQQDFLKMLQEKKDREKDFRKATEEESHITFINKWINKLLTENQLTAENNHKLVG